MDVIDFIKVVETNYDVKSINVNNIQVWGFLRSIYFWNFDAVKNHPESLKIEYNHKNFLLNSFYGLRNLFKKSSYILFSNNRELRLRDGVYIHKIADVLFELLRKENFLSIENPTNSCHRPISELSMKRTISLNLFTLMSFINPFPFKVDINNEALLKEINNKYNLNIDYRKKIKKFLAYRSLFIFLFKIKKPKLVFMTDYCNIVNQAAINAARTLGIKTIELQHGDISPKHPAYNVYSNINKDLFPEYLLVFGIKTKDTFNDENYFIDKKNVFPIGNMYIDYINNEYELPQKLKNDFIKYRIKYKKIVAISSQYTIENELISFLKNAARISKDILFIFVPRSLEIDYIYANFPKNIIVIKDLDVYQTIKFSDFHSTVYSTCALEAPALGVPNILINIKNESKRYYLDILDNPDVTKFVDTPEEYVNTIQTWDSKSKEGIKRLHEGFYAKNHKDNLIKVLKILEGKQE
jgi:hypothetical protein